MSDLFTARFADCIFNEDHFPSLGEIINLSMMIGKLIGMTSLSYPLTHVQRRLNLKFRKFQSYSKLLVTCQMRLPIRKVSQNL
jgi:hypothetical protein